jgi:hypothetical protein
MTFDKWFEEQALWLKIVLLVIPFVGWVMEILIRVSAVIRKSSVINIVGLVIGVFGNIIWAIIDLVFMILKGQLLLVE